MAVFKQLVKLLQDDSKEPQLIDLTYLWKLVDYSKIPLDEPRLSAAFMVEKDSYQLELSKLEHLTVQLRQVKSRQTVSKFLCAASLVDRHGKLRHFVRKEAEMGKDATTKELLKIPCEVLAREKSDIIPMDTLSIRFSIQLLTENSLMSTCDNDRSLEALSCDLKNLHEEKTDFDVVLKARDAVYKAHRLLLSARSPAFAKMLRQNAKEPPKGSIDITDVEGSILGNVLYYIYTGKAQGLTSDTASRLIEAADRFQLQELMDMSTRFLAANLTMENICDSILVAEKFRDGLLETAAFAFISKNAYEVIHSDHWKDFKTKHPEVANSVLSSILLSAQK